MIGDTDLGASKNMADRASAGNTTRAAKSAGDSSPAVPIIAVFLIANRTNVAAGSGCRDDRARIRSTRPGQPSSFDRAAAW